MIFSKTMMDFRRELACRMLAGPHLVVELPGSNQGNAGKESSHTEPGFSHLPQDGQSEQQPVADLARYL